MLSQATAIALIVLVVGFLLKMSYEIGVRAGMGMIMGMGGGIEEMSKKMKEMLETAKELESKVEVEVEE